jgi:transposase
MNARKKYSKEFKLDAISLVVEQQYTRAEAARSLEINPNLITRWIKEHEQDNDGQAFRGNGKLTPEQEEIRQLKAKVRQLEMDKNILKEATEDSSQQSNTLFNHVRWCFKFQCFSWTLI